MKKNLNYSLIGAAGYWSNILIKTIQSLNFHLEKVYDPKGFENPIPYQVAQNYDEILNDSTIDAVIIATPPATHYELAKKALMADKDVWVEKPLGVNSGETDELWKIARDRKRILFVDNTFIYSSEVRTLQNIFKLQLFGKPLLFQSTRANLGPFKTDVDVIVDLIPHDLSILLSLPIGWPKYVIAKGTSNINPDIIDDADVFFEYPDGFSAKINVSWVSPKKTRYMKLFTDKGFWECDVAVNKKSFFNNQEVHMDDYGEPLPIALNHFDNCVKNRFPPLSSGLRGHEIVFLSEKISQSIRERREIKI